MVDHVTAGCVCAVPGLVNTYGRQGIGACPDGELPSLEPVLSYKVMYPTDVDAVTMVSKLRQLDGHHQAGIPQCGDCHRLLSYHAACRQDQP